MEVLYGVWPAHELVGRVCARQFRAEIADVVIHVFTYVDGRLCDHELDCADEQDVVNNWRAAMGALEAEAVCAGEGACWGCP